MSWINVLGWMMVIYGICLFRRNLEVGNYRRRILNEVSRLARQDIRSGRPWEWRYEMFVSVGYASMLLKFWKSLDSFWENKSFFKRYCH